MYGVLSADPPRVTAGNFENFLASDCVFAQYFNEFLSLPALLYNQETGQFEMLSKAAEVVSNRIKSVLHRSKSQLPHDPTVLAKSPLVDNRYTASYLDREQGIQWVIKARLPFFLQSTCYFEYRLAKLLFQWNPNANPQKRKCRMYAQVNRENNSDKQSQTGLPFPENTSAKQGSVRMHTFSHLPSVQKRPIDTTCSESFRSSCCLKSSTFTSNLKCEKTHGLRGPHARVNLYFTEPSAGSRQKQHLQESSPLNYESFELQLEYLAAKIVKQVLEDALTTLNGQSWTNRRNLKHCSCTDRPCVCKFCQYSAGEDSQTMDGKGHEGKRRNEPEKKSESDKMNRAFESGCIEHKNVIDICCHGTCGHSNKPGLDEFKDFLKGSPGDKLFNLWLDIERLKAIQLKERKNNYLVLMRSQYLLSSSQNSLNMELLSRLGLTTSPCWIEEKLCSIQPYLIQSLFCYWGPRFWTSNYAQTDPDDSANTVFWREGCVRLPSDTHRGFVAPPPPICPDNWQIRLPRSAHTQFYSSRGKLTFKRRVEKMLQALCVEARTGLFFTHFCEQSGNQLWENAIYFWTDLLHYRELFYQKGLDPYRVQRQAQLLYSRYISTSAWRSTGVSEEIRRTVYDHLMPAFEELFDEAEEHTLNVLLVPWSLLVSRDEDSFHQVCVHEEQRCIDSQEFRELQSLFKESERQLKQVKSCSFVLSPSVSVSTAYSKGSRTADSWSNVPLRYQGYRLGSLLRHRHEIGHFMSFLQNQNTSIHLACWLDLEKYRRTPQKDTANRQERAAHIAKKYLSRKYFFGPDSPATAEQRNDILRLAGGMARLKQDCLSNSVILEIQEIVRSHIEETWLPLFLATPEFTERQKHKPKLQTADRLSQLTYQRRRKRREGWKGEGLWMNSSKEILLFRRILLNPVTCMQFQHFVSLKGDYLENDLLFWLEVQRYKDLCHSHSDDATIQKKISTIIGCFINSSMPPALQIDIPPEQAQHILEKRHQLGPYIFREAQMSVFSELLKFWPEFQELRCSVEEERLLPLLEEKRIKHKARVRRQRRKEEEEEERRAQEATERCDSTFEEEEAVNNDKAEKKEEEGRKCEKRAQTRDLLCSTQPLSWSYSKYMAALKREEVLLRRQIQKEASFSTASDSTDCSMRSGSRHSYHQAS